MNCDCKKNMVGHEVKILIADVGFLTARIFTLNYNEDFHGLSGSRGKNLVMFYLF